MSESFYQRVYNAVCKIPNGKVATYGQIACIAGSPKASRVVGYALHVNPSPLVIPCHRVVNRFGKLADSFAFGGIEAQRKLLEAEGVLVDNSFCVDLSIYIWKQDF